MTLLSFLSIRIVEYKKQINYFRQKSPILFIDIFPISFSKTTYSQFNFTLKHLILNIMHIYIHVCLYVYIYIHIYINIYIGSKSHHLN